MDPIELSSSQTRNLRALTHLYIESETEIKAEEIAEQVNRNPGTIRNQMQSLKALQLVEAVPGPKGGYKPTTLSYKILDIQQISDPISIPVSHEDRSIEGVIVEDINLSNVHHPELCRAEVYLQAEIDDIHAGDIITIGPTPLSRLIVKGEIEGIDEINNTVILTIMSIIAPANDPIE